MKLTEEWLIKKRLILKRSDRIDSEKDLVYVNDLLPLTIVKDDFYFEWNGHTTHVPTVEHLQTLYLAITHRILSIDER